MFGLVPVHTAHTQGTNATLAMQRCGFGILDCVAYSPDGRYVATGGGMGAVLWDVSTGAVVRTFTGHTYRVWSVAFSPDGTKVLTGSLDDSAKLWDSGTGVLLRTFSGHSRDIYSVAFSPDGTKVVTGAADDTAKIWDAVTGEVIRTFVAAEGVLSVAFSPDGTKVVTGAGDSTVNLWDTDSGSLLRTFSGHSGAIYSVAFSPDGTKVVTGAGDSTAKIWDASSGTEIHTLSGHSPFGWLNSVAFSSDSTKVLTGSDDNTAKIWDVASGGVIRTFSGHTNAIRSVAFSPDGSKILTGSRDQTAKIWDAPTGAVIRTFSGHLDNVFSVAFSPDGLKVLTGGGTAKLWDAATGGLTGTFYAYSPLFRSAAFSPDGTIVLIVDNYYIHLVSAETGAGVEAWYVTSPACAVFSPDGTKVLSGSGNGNADLWDAGTGVAIRTFSGHTYGVSSVAFSPDGTKVLTGTGGGDNTAKLWEEATGSLIRSYSGHTGGITSVAYSPDGTKVLTASWDQTAKLWDLATGTLIRTFSGHTRPILSAAFSPDGTKILTGSADKTVKLWDIATGQILRTFTGHTDEVYSVAFSPDETKVVTGSRDGTARIWELNPPRAIIVSGGGNFLGNPIADQTNDLGAYAYQTLKRRGYTAADILYLSAFPTATGGSVPAGQSAPWLDADGDGLNDVDGWATTENLKKALTGLAEPGASDNIPADFGSGAGRLMLLMMDHGYTTGDFMAFRLNETQLLPAADLDPWLDDLQANHSIDITLVVDSCYSGHFVEKCGGGVGGHQRIVLASTGKTTEAAFLPPPDLTSFIYTFLSSAYMGNSMGEAWRAGKRFFEDFPVAGQIPQLVDDSTGTLNADRQFFGATWAYGVQSTQDVNQFFPAFEDWTHDATIAPGSPVLLWTRMLPGQNPNEVVAVIRPPAPEVLSGDPVTNLPHLSLIQNATDPTLWEATATELFTDLGQSVISFSARFDFERVSNPVFSRITLSAGPDPDSTPIRAILAVGDTSDPTLQSAFGSLAPYAYSVYLDRFQDNSGIHHPEWIDYYTAALDSDRDGLPSSSSVINSIDNLPLTIGRLYVHLVGNSNTPGQVEMASGDALTATALDTTLDNLQSRQVCTVVLVVDAPKSGSFLSTCKATGLQQRVLLTGSRETDTALFLSGSSPTSFSYKFLTSSYQGNHLKDGFTSGKNFFRSFLRSTILPLLDDNGDGVSNKYDGNLAKDLFLGRRYAFAGDDASELPFILSIAPERAMAATGTPVLFTAHLIEGVTPTRVFAQVVPAGIDTGGAPIDQLEEVDFNRDSPEGWSWSGSVIVPATSGMHTLAAYASYPDATSEALSVPVFAALGDNSGDAYEPDDSSAFANPFYIGAGNQSHSLNTETDEDWVTFDVVEDLPYSITATAVGADLDVALEIYAATDLEIPLEYVDDELEGTDELLSGWIAPAYGRYYVRVSNVTLGPSSFPEYQLSITQDTGAGNGTATPISGGLRISWSPSVGKILSGIRIDRSLSFAGPYSTAANLSPNSSTHEDIGLLGMTTYYYLVYELDINGNAGQLTNPFGGTTTTGPTPTFTSVPTATLTKTNTVTPTPTATLSPVPPPTATFTPAPTNTPTPSPTPTATNVPPVVSLSLLPQAGNPPLSVDLIGSGTDTDGTLTQSVWAFGESGVEDVTRTVNTANLTEATTHVYSQPGVYDLLFRVWDDRGSIQEATGQVAVWTPVPTFTHTWTPVPTDTDTPAPTPTSTFSETPTPSFTPTPAPEVWVDFSYSGTAQGTLEEPYNTFAEAIPRVQTGGTVNFKPGTTSESLRVTKSMHLHAPLGGPVRIGVGGGKHEQKAEVQTVIIPGDRSPTVRSDGTVDVQGLLRLIENIQANKAERSAILQVALQWMR